jgi:HD-GYP domain-containing protein (c-di-GMP phosphodiesterase class II)
LEITASKRLQFKMMSTPLMPRPCALDRDASSDRLVQSTSIRFSEIIAALSVALDLTQGHPQGHSMRSCLIGMRIAQQLGLSPADRSALYYALLLKDLGCSSNAAKIAYLFGGDDHQIKHTARLIDWTKPAQCIKHCWTNCAPGGSAIDKLVKVSSIIAGGPAAGKKIAEIRCERGAAIAKMLRLSDATATAIYHLDEHWNGRGNPKGLKGEQISILGRICGLAQTVEVFFSESGLSAAYQMARERRGKWFDPEVVDALLSFQHDQEFWTNLAGADLMAQIGLCEPENEILIADEEGVDRVAEAFAQVVDAKSPWTYQHSSRVADIAVGIASQFDFSPGMLRDIRRVGLLHDIGKLGVSNAILDKPGKPTSEEFAQIQKHPEYSYRILLQVRAFHQLAEVAGGHHERLDGHGYFRGVEGDQISLVTRILTAADIFEALTAKRPYRDAMTWDQVEAILAKDAGKGVDPQCLELLKKWRDKSNLVSRVELQLEAVEQLAAAF